MKSVLVIGVLFILASCTFPVIPEPPDVSRCTFAAGISCSEFDIVDSQLEITIVNGFGRSIDMERITYRDFTGAGCTVLDFDAEQVPLPNGGQTTIGFFEEGCSIERGILYEIELEYRNTGAEASLGRRVLGEVYFSR